MTVISGTHKSDLHKQNVGVCFFSEQKWTYSVQACKEEFLANYLDQNNLEKSLLIVLLRAKKSGTSHFCQF
jgi:hypothetical protein